MCNEKCGGCCPAKRIIKVLLVIGGINWGLVGIGMLTGSGSDMNIVHIAIGAAPGLEAFIYLLVGIAAVAKVFGCKCKKCVSACNSCKTDSKVGGSM